MKKALITWITGQDWAYLAELLLNKWYEVHWLRRRSSLLNTQRIDHLFKDVHEKNVNLFLYYSDMTDSANLIKLITKIQPDEIYNLAAQSHVQVSFEMPEYTANSDAIWVLRLLEAIRISWLEKTCKFYQASTSEMYGWVWYNMPTTWYTEESPFHPRSPYWVAKLYGYRLTRNYREAYNMFTSNWILFNHESPIRWENFVTRKITRAIAKIKLGLQKKLYLWNLNAKRDRWHAKDYVEWMRLMLQQETPDDFVLATWKIYTVRDFVIFAFQKIWINIEWRWEWIEEKWYDAVSGDCLIEIDSRYFRPSEVDVLLWDAAKARKILWWEPKHSLEELISEMIEADLKTFKKEEILKKHGYEILNQYE
ncbi:MAG: hypothetical protein ACD_80C00151G0006 [uncultured bacterium (gcode 4)]|uniref:GDP-mannose 4,6-dehydratase n=1 Tax=uncultured bacterium (gcode 4) TaxID=1234023 RepID=K1XHR5_9BACT|nr:MAG: hypothetical protein ACD_80C00151G0006 [uncultured bacterium (gcode 4)]